MVLAIVCMGLNGCHLLVSGNTEESRDVSGQLLKKSKMAPDSVVVEVSMIAIPVTRKKGLEEFWKSLDVTRVDLQRRKLWDSNGMRVAITGNALPLEFEKLLEVEKKDQSGTDAGETKLAPRRRLQTRSGKPFRIATQNIRPQVTWLVAQEDGYRKGGLLLNAQTEFVVRVYPKGDGGVWLRLEPEILYGEEKQVVVPTNQAFRYESKRDSINFPELQLDTELALGESIVVSGIPQAGNNDLFGLGHSFFVEKDGDIKFFVIRIAQTQQDDLFGSSPFQQPLESLTE